MVNLILFHQPFESFTWHSMVCCQILMCQATHIQQIFVWCGQLCGEQSLTSVFSLQGISLCSLRSKRYEFPSKWNRSVATFVQGNIGTSWPNAECVFGFFFNLEYFRHNWQLSTSCSSWLFSPGQYTTCFACRVCILWALGGCHGSAWEWPHVSCLVWQFEFLLEWDHLWWWVPHEISSMGVGLVESLWCC